MYINNNVDLVYINDNEHLGNEKVLSIIKAEVYRQRVNL